MYQFKRPYSEFIDFKQDFIDMVVYDIKLLNPDRGLENWFIRQNKSTKAIDLYPMFDNEMILGFDDDISYSKTLSNEKLSYSQEDIKRSSAIVTPDEMINNKNSVNYKKLFTFLLNRYPIQTQNALDKFKNFDISNLYEILNSLPDLSENRKNFALKLFDCRSKSLEEIYKNNKKIQKEINYR